MWIRACLIAVLLVAALGKTTGRWNCAGTEISLVDRIVLSAITGKTTLHMPTD